MTLLAIQHVDSTRWLMLLFDTAVKSLLLLSIAATVTWAIRRRSAAMRHMVWTLSIIGLLCLPVLSTALPGLEVSLPQPVRAKLAMTQHDQTVSEPIAAVTETRKLMSDNLSPEGDATANAAVAPVPAIQSEQPFDLHWSAWAFVIWAAVTLTMLASMTVGVLMVRRHVRRSIPAPEGWISLLNRICNRMGVSAKVRLLKSDWSNIPFTCGILRPSIVLPKEADEWSTERRNIVLVHEVAHIKRADCLTQLIARLARTLYWFNPLTWVACRMLRIEQERACDDLVLASGHMPSEYASHLLEIVRTLRSMRCQSPAAVAMARKSHFEGRMLAILDQSRNRRAITRLGALVATVLLAGVVVPVACIRASGPDKPELSQTAQSALNTEGKFCGTLTSGITVELISVSQHPSEGKAWWRPDGSPMEKAPHARMASTGIGQVEPGKRAVELAIAVTNAPTEDIGVTWKWDAVTSTCRSDQVMADGKIVQGLRAIEGILPADRHVTGFTVGIASGQWSTRYSASVRGQEVIALRGQRVISIEVNAGGAVFSPVIEQAGQTIINVAYDLPADYEARVVAIDQSGKLHTGELTGGSAGKTRQSTATFHMPASEIKGYKLQARPYEWIRFRNISLEPGQKTDVEVITGPEASSAVEKALDPTKTKQVKAWVEKFFRSNYRDITARQTIEWGQPQQLPNGNLSIRYKYLATIWDKDKVTDDQVFTFTPQGKFVSVEKIMPPAPADPQARQQWLVDRVKDFFNNNYRDITARQTIEWDQPQQLPDGNLSIRYKYLATIWGKDKITFDEVFTFTPQGKFVSAKKLSKAPATQPSTQPN